MTERKDGGPAYPRTYDNNIDSVFEGPDGHNGMSLRDWFAGMFMSGLEASMQDGHGKSDYADIAESAYYMADAMLERRDK